MGSVKLYWILAGGNWHGPFDNGPEAIDYCEANELLFAIYTTIGVGSLPLLQEPVAWMVISKEAQEYIIGDNNVWSSKKNTKGQG